MPCIDDRAGKELAGSPNASRVVLCNNESHARHKIRSIAISLTPCLLPPTNISHLPSDMYTLVMYRLLDLLRRIWLEAANLLYRA